MFLTATPFQLGRHELLHIVNFFRSSRRHAGDEDDFMQRRQALADAMDAYIEALAGFGEAWRDLDAARAERVAHHIAGGTADADPLVTEAIDAFSRARAAKVRLEVAMHPFVLRSTRERHIESMAPSMTPI